MSCTHAAPRKRVPLEHLLRWCLGITVGLMALRAARAVEEVTSEDIRQNLYDACFINDEEGWAVGDLARIFHTTDGARNWSVESAGTKKPFVAVSCPDRGNLWIAGQMGQIAHSTDGGSTWTAQDSGTTRQLLDIDFPNPQHGIAVGDFGALRRTEDGGKTWTEAKLPTDTRLPPDVAEIVQPGDVVIYAVSYPDPEHAWIVGEFGVILASTDGGQTYQPQTSPVETSLFGVFFADAQRGWAVGLEETLLATTDGGITWTKQQVEAPRGFTLALYDVEVRGNNGWAIGNSGILLHSEDAGTTWKLMDVPVMLRSGWFRGISLLPDGHGYVVGARGLVVVVDGDKLKSLKENY